MSRLNLIKKVLRVHFKDAPPMSDEDDTSKCNKTTTATTDSGFLSGGNLTISGELDVEPLTDSGLADSVHSASEAHRVTPSPYMRLDSGVDLSENFSSLSVKHHALNDLSASTRPPRQQQQPPQTMQQHRQRSQHPPADPPPWALCFAQDNNGDTKLHMAIAQEKPSLALVVIRAAPHPSLLDIRNVHGNTALHMAIATRQWQVVRWLVIAGAHPSRQNRQGNTPLHVSAYNGDLRCCKALTLPVKQRELQVMALGYTPQPYHAVNFEVWNYNGQTCVHVAAIYGHINILRHVVFCGANVNAREGCGGDTALHYAIKKHDERMAFCLIQQCPQLDVSVMNYGRRGPLQLGVRVSKTLCDALTKLGADTSDDEESSSSEEDEDSENEEYCT